MTKNIIVKNDEDIVLYIAGSQGDTITRLTVTTDSTVLETMQGRLIDGKKPAWFVDTLKLLFRKEV